MTGQNVFNDTLDWLAFVGMLLSPGFRRLPRACIGHPVRLVNSVHSWGDHRRRPGHDLGSHVDDPRYPRNLTLSAPLALALAARSPPAALDERHSQSSQSFPLPLPLLLPLSLGVSLCPGCHGASPEGVARVWSDFRVPSLLIGLIQHATLSVPGSCGLVGQVIVSG